MSQQKSKSTLTLLAILAINLLISCQGSKVPGLSNPGSGSESSSFSTTPQDQTLDASSASFDMQKLRSRCRCVELLSAAERGPFSEDSQTKVPEYECTYQLANRDSQSFLNVTLYYGVSMDDYRKLISKSYGINEDELSELNLRVPLVHKQNLGRTSQKMVAHRLHERSIAALITEQFSNQSLKDNTPPGPSIESVGFLFSLVKNADKACTH